MFVDECHVTRLNQGLFSTTMEAEKRDPGNEVGALYVKEIKNQFRLDSATVVYKAMLCFYKAFIIPHLYCCSIVWHFFSKQDSDKLVLVNKLIIRFVFKEFNSGCNDLLKLTGTVILRN